MAPRPHAQIVQSGDLADLQMAQEGLNDQVTRHGLLIAGHEGQLRQMGTVTTAVQGGGAALQSTLSGWTAGVIATGALLIAVVALVGGLVVWNSTEILSLRRDLTEGQSRTDKALAELKAGLDLLIAAPGPAPAAPSGQTPTRPED